MGGLLSGDSHVMSSEELFQVVNNQTSKEIREELFEVADDNGYIFCKRYCIPEEILSIILSYVEPKNLVFDCRRVCKTWCNVIDSQVWRLKFQRINYIVPKVQELPWFACYWIFTKKTLNRNLIKNGCGEENFKHWNILSNGGDRWKIEKPPSGSENFPEDADEEVLKNNSCFVTSFTVCVKEQIIDLAAEGATPEFMDIIKPIITVSEWYAGRFDCRCVYQLIVELLDENKLPLHPPTKSDESRTQFRNNGVGAYVPRRQLLNLESSYVTKGHFEIRKGAGSADGWAWHKVTHVFDNFGPGVRYIKFAHSGKDSQFWKGHYGSKMTGASVVLTLPKNFVQASF